MKIEHAKTLYAIGGESKEIALEYFPELKERTLPKTWEEYVISNKDTADITHIPVSTPIKPAMIALERLYLLKQEYNGDWVADYNNLNQVKHVVKLYEFLPCRFLAFKSLSLRDQFAANFADLIEAAKPLLG